MTTLKEFEDALREHGLTSALAVLEKLRERDKSKRSMAPARRISGRKMTPELAREVLTLHRTTGMTQQEIAFKLGVNQGRVNEVIKRGKWLEDNPAAPEAVARDRAVARIRRGTSQSRDASKAPGSMRPRPRRKDQGQLAFSDF